MTLKTLKSLARYDSKTGFFYWLTGPRRNARVGWASHHHWRVNIGGIETSAARMAWFYTHGEWPKGELMHLNGDFLDDRIANLALKAEWKTRELTPEHLREIIHYAPTTGAFEWRGPRRKGQTAGTINDKGYVIIAIKSKDYRAHWLAWVYVHGRWPKDRIDHINGNRSDNRIANLRECTQAQNVANSRKPKTNRSGFKGVSWSAAAKKWQAHIRHQGKSMYLGLFESPEAAHEAYCTAARVLKKEFARTT